MYDEWRIGRRGTDDSGLTLKMPEFIFKMMCILQ